MEFKSCQKIDRPTFVLPAHSGFTCSVVLEMFFANPVSCFLFPTEKQADSTREVKVFPKSLHSAKRKNKDMVSPDFKKYLDA